MFEEALYPKTEQVLKKLESITLVQNFYLAGGTGLALQLGHRKSIDLDFFTSEYPKPEIFLQKFQHLNPKITQQNAGTIDLIIDTVKVSFLEYNYPLLYEKLIYSTTQVASQLDIGCMKLTAISSRGAKKDFIDLFFILKNISLEELLNDFKRKYTNISYSESHLLKSLTYFADADKDPDVDLLQKCDWNEVKNSLKAITLSYMRNI